MNNLLHKDVIWGAFSQGKGFYSKISAPNFFNLAKTDYQLQGVSNKTMFLQRLVCTLCSEKIIQI